MKALHFLTYTVWLDQGGIIAAYNTSRYIHVCAVVKGLILNMVNTCTVTTLMDRTYSHHTHVHALHLFMYGTHACIHTGMCMHAHTHAWTHTHTRTRACTHHHNHVYYAIV